MKAFKTKQECQLFKDKIDIIEYFFSENGFTREEKSDDNNIDYTFYEKDNVVAKWLGSCFEDLDLSDEEEVEYMLDDGDEYTHEDLFEVESYGPFTFSIETIEENPEDSLGVLFNLYSITRQSLIEELGDIKEEFGF